jgi:hypothetical protein
MQEPQALRNLKTLETRGPANNIREAVFVGAPTSFDVAAAVYRALTGMLGWVMVRKPSEPTEPPKLGAQVSWNVYFVGKVGRWIGTVEAKTGRAAIFAFAKRSGYSPHKLFVIKRR